MNPSALPSPLLQVFKEEEEAVKVELHEGCGRIKLYWTMALADYRTLKGMIEFRETGSSEVGIEHIECPRNAANTSMTLQWNRYL